MPFSINEVPNKALDILLNSLNQPLRGFSPWPENVWIVQDAEVIHYRECLQILKFNCVFHPIEEKEKVLWQIFQTYRVINTAISSKHHSMKPFKEGLKQLRNELENDPESSLLLQAKDHDPNMRDIICSGHGMWYESDGYIKLPSAMTEVIFYAIEGASIAASLSINIENNHLVSKDIVISDDVTDEKMFLPNNVDYPYRYNQNDDRMIPNYTLSSDQRHKARIIEDGTGRILYESNSYITLSEIIDKFPNRIIHWAPCVVMFSKENKPIGLHLNYTWIQLSAKQKIKMGSSIIRDNSHFYFGKKKHKTLSEKVLREEVEKTLSNHPSKNPLNQFDM